MPTMGLSHDRHMFFCNNSRPFFRVSENSGLKLDYLYRISIRATHLGMLEAFSSIYKDGCGDFGTLSDTRHSAPVRVCRSGPGGFVAHLDVETASMQVAFALRFARAQFFEAPNNPERHNGEYVRAAAPRELLPEFVSCLSSLHICVYFLVKCKRMCQ